MRKSAIVTIAALTAVTKVPAYFRAAVVSIDGSCPAVFVAAIFSAPATAIAEVETMLWLVLTLRAFGFTVMHEVAVIAKLAMSLYEPSAQRFPFSAVTATFGGVYTGRRVRCVSISIWAW